MSRWVRKRKHRGSKSLKDMLSNSSKNPLRRKMTRSKYNKSNNSLYGYLVNRFKKFERNNRSSYKTTVRLHLRDTLKLRKKIRLNSKAGFKRKRRLKLRNKNLMKRLNINSHMMSN